MKKALLILFTFISSLVYSQSYDICIPNAFTPDGDGLNDKFQPILYGHKSVTLTIVTRNDMVIYNSNDGDGWDGTYKGFPCEQGCYLYEIVVTDSSDQKHVYFGILTLLRSK